MSIPFIYVNIQKQQEDKTNVDLFCILNFFFSFLLCKTPPPPKNFKNAIKKEKKNQITLLFQLHFPLPQAIHIPALHICPSQTTEEIKINEIHVILCIRL